MFILVTARCDQWLMTIAHLFIGTLEKKTIKIDAAYWRDTSAVCYLFQINN